MSRPRKDSACPDMRAALFTAFWKLLQHERLERIHVSAITGQANCNRGTFYYHFRDMDDLLYQAMRAELVDNPALTTVICNITVGGPGYTFSHIISEPAFEHARLLLVHGGMEQTSGLMQRLALDAWTEVLRSDEDAPLRPETHFIIEYAVGGMLTLLSNCLERSGTAEDLRADADIISVFLKDNAAHMLHQISRTEDIPEAEILKRLRAHFNASATTV